MQRLIVIAAIITVLAGLVLGFLAIGPPGTTRRKLFDDQRISDLRMIADAIGQKSGDGRTTLGSGAVPLPELYRPDGSNVLIDPETGVPYEIKPVDAHHYDLCAVFSTSSENEPIPRWHHRAGRTCFLLDTRKSGSHS